MAIPIPEETLQLVLQHIETESPRVTSALRAHNAIRQAVLDAQPEAEERAAGEPEAFQLGKTIGEEEMRGAVIALIHEMWPEGENRPTAPRRLISEIKKLVLDSPDREHGRDQAADTGGDIRRDAAGVGLPGRGGSAPADPVQAADQGRQAVDGAGARSQGTGKER